MGTMCPVWPYACHADRSFLDGVLQLLLLPVFCDRAGAGCLRRSSDAGCMGCLLTCQHVQLGACMPGRCGSQTCHSIGASLGQSGRHAKQPSYMRAFVMSPCGSHCPFHMLCNGGHTCTKAVKEAGVCCKRSWSNSRAHPFTYVQALASAACCSSVAPSSTSYYAAYATFRSQFQHADCSRSDNHGTIGTPRS